MDSALFMSGQMPHRKRTKCQSTFLGVFHPQTPGFHGLSGTSRCVRNARGNCPAENRMLVRQRRNIRTWLPPLCQKPQFYSTSDGVSELWDFLEDLQTKALTNKDARIQHKQISQYIQLLADHGTRLGENITKHLEEDIWELRPGNNRVLFFYHKDDTYVLLHQFRKKTQKTPRREIDKAMIERDDWKSRKG